ncbi:MAG: bacterial Ig-like domain-containing protein [Bacilli bacterium]|nr:bacterial Ig-like domain-containing protein [Bacilli bacterium]
MNKIHKLLILSSTLFFVVSCGETPSKIEEPTLENISLSGTYQTEFFVDDAFTYDGLIVTAYYSDNSTKTIEENNYAVSSPDMSYKGAKEVTVTYLNKTATYSVTVNEKSGPQIELIDITLSGTYETEFEVGDTFNYDGLIVTAIYNTGDPVVVTPTSVSTPNMNLEGEQIITLLI